MHAHLKVFNTKLTSILAAGFKDPIGDEEFKNAVYTIDIGQNDLAGSFTYLSYSQVTERIPSFIAEIEGAIWVIT